MIYPKKYQLHDTNLLTYYMKNIPFKFYSRCHTFMGWNTPNQDYPKKYIKYTFLVT